MPLFSPYLVEGYTRFGVGQRTRRNFAFSVGDAGSDTRHPYRCARSEYPPGRRDDVVRYDVLVCRADNGLLRPTNECRNGQRHVERESAPRRDSWLSHGLGRSLDAVRFWRCARGPPGPVRHGPVPATAATRPALVNGPVRRTAAAARDRPQLPPRQARCWSSGLRPNDTGSLAVPWGNARASRGNDR